MTVLLERVGLAARSFVFVKDRATARDQIEPIRPPGVIRETQLQGGDPEELRLNHDPRFEAALFHE
jgi:hypothetical protein